MTLDPRITFSRASQGTFYGADGLLRYAAHNAAWPSSDFSHVNWTKASGGTVTVDATTAPDSTLTADRLNHVTAGTVAGGYAVSSISTILIGFPVIQSVYAKAGTKNWLIIALGGGVSASAHAFFNLATGVVGTRGANWVSTGIESVGSGWYRCWGLSTPAGSNGSFAIRVAETDASVNCTSPGDIYIWGAQAENVTTATTPSTYIPTTTAAVHGPRLDYDPVTHVARGLLIEEARTNNALYSQDFSNGNWVKTGLTVTADQTTAPDGTTTADLITSSASPASMNLPVNATSNYVVSVFAKKGTSDWVYIVGQVTDTPKAWFNLNTGAVGTVQAGITSASIQNVGNGWYRCIIVDVSGTGNEPCTFGLSDADNSTTVTVGRTAYLWGAQNESAVDFVSSYIPVPAGSSVLRAADVAVMTGTAFSSWYNQPAGTFVAEFDVFSVATAFQGIISADNAATSNRIYFQINSADPIFSVVSGSANQGNLDLGTVVKNTVLKMGGSYASNDLAGCLNGGTVVLDTGAVIPTALPQTQLRIGVDASSNYMSGHLRRIRFFNVAKTDAELITLTSTPPAVATMALTDKADGALMSGWGLAEVVSASRAGLTSAVVVEDRTGKTRII